MGIPILTGEQSRKALHYSVLWLKEEIKDITKAIENEPDDALLEYLVQRKAELDRDFAEFSALNN
jgi:hypothetical protein